MMVSLTLTPTNAHTHTQHPRSRTKSRLKKQRSITTTITTTLTMAPPKVTITTRRTTLRRRHDPCPRRRPVAQHSLPRLERRDPLLLDDRLPTVQVRQNLTYTRTHALARASVLTRGHVCSVSLVVPRRQRAPGASSVPQHTQELPKRRQWRLSARADKGATRGAIGSQAASAHCCQATDSRKQQSWTACTTRYFLTRAHN